jgi:DNA-directed RNA polymerase specialized sigma24 family protein
MINEQDLARLLELAKGGDSASLGQLCEEARVRLTLIVKYRLRGWSETERQDLVQDTLLTFCEKIQVVDRTPMAFALWILRQKIGNEFQKVRRSRERSFSNVAGDSTRDDDNPSLDPADPADDPATAYDRKETLTALRDAIGKLDEFCRAVFAGLLEGMKMQEIWERYRDLEPRLHRGAFDKRTHMCRRKLLALVGAIE